jgi:V/A-type H+/Na+-transporting ATPase subunit E
MKALEKGQDTIQKISDRLKHEVIEPAKVEAHKIVGAAQQKAEEIIALAEKQADATKAAAYAQIEKERRVFQSSLQQASKQSLEALRQAIEQKLFNEQLNALVETGMADPQLIAKLIDAIVSAIEKEGLGTDLTAVVSRVASPQAISKLLAQEVLKKLKGKALTLDGFAGGAQVKIEDKQIRVDLSDNAIKELLSNYVRKDFRDLVFG